MDLQERLETGQQGGSAWLSAKRTVDLETSGKLPWQRCTPLVHVVLHCGWGVSQP